MGQTISTPSSSPKRSVKPVEKVPIKYESKDEIIQKYAEMRHVNSLLVEKNEVDRRAEILKKYNIAYNNCYTNEQLQELRKTDLEKEYQDIIQKMVNEWNSALCR